MRSAFALSLLVLVSCGREAAAPPGDEAYGALFFSSGDLPGMHLAQDSRGRGPEDDDTAFAKHHGQRAGTASWLGARDASIYRVVDSRWVFPNAERAHAYLEDTWLRHADQDMPIQATKVGEDCRVFGGKRGFEGATVTQITYLFRVGRFVVRINATQGPAVTGTTLTADGVEPLAEKIATRLSGKSG